MKSAKFKSMANGYKLAAQRRKAEKLAAHLHAHGIVAEETALITPEQWEQLANVVGVNAPSDETIALVGEILAGLESAKAEVSK